MRNLTALAFITGLAACETTPPAPVSAELSAQVTAHAETQNARKGEELGSDFVFDGAEASGNTVIRFIRVRHAFADRIRDVPEGQLANSVERDFRDDFCRDPFERAFILAGGETDVIFRDEIRRELFAVNIDHC